jgi:hypothetical protein
MSRDELLHRPVALRPELPRLENRCSIYPSEPGGGTWIGFNDRGLALAVITGMRLRRGKGTERSAVEWFSKRYGQRSHLPKPSALSICMHGENAGKVLHRGRPGKQPGDDALASGSWCGDSADLIERSKSLRML